MLGCVISRTANMFNKGASVDLQGRHLLTSTESSDNTTLIALIHMIIIDIDVLIITEQEVGLL